MTPRDAIAMAPRALEELEEREAEERLGLSRHQSRYEDLVFIMVCMWLTFFLVAGWLGAMFDVGH